MITRCIYKTEIKTARIIVVENKPTLENNPVIELITTKPVTEKDVNKEVNKVMGRTLVSWTTTSDYYGLTTEEFYKAAKPVHRSPSGRKDETN